jgi:hypothetical protein
LLPKSAKIHVHTYTIPKIFPGVIPRTPFQKGRGEEGRGEEESGWEGGEEEGRGETEGGWEGGEERRVGGGEGRGGEGRGRGLGGKGDVRIHPSVGIRGAVPLYLSVIWFRHIGPVCRMHR